MIRFFQKKLAFITTINVMLNARRVLGRLRRRRRNGEWEKGR